MSVSIKDHVYIVTGGSEGFGLSIAMALVAQQAKVGLVSRSADKLDKAQDILGPDNCFYVAADVADSDVINAAFESIKEHFGRLDGLINNAGVARGSLIEKYSDEEISVQLDVNIRGLLYCSRAAIPLLKDSPNPRIVNISSASAEHHDEMFGLSLYAASKSAVERLSRDLRREMQEYNIGVTLLRPGAAATHFADGWDFDKLAEIVDLWHKRSGPHQDAGMETSHVGEAVVFCVGMDRGVSVDEIEIRPNRLVDKVRF